MHKMRAPHNLIIWLAISAAAVVGMLMLCEPVGAYSESSIQQEEPSEDILYDRQRALSTVDYMAQLVPTLPRPENQVTSYTTLGEVLWRYDQARARDYFRTAFSTIDQVKVDDGTDEKDQQRVQRRVREKRHQLRLQVLRRAARLDRQLGRELTDQMKALEADASVSNESFDSQGLMDLATVLLEDDPEEAINLAKASLRQGVHPDFGTFLLSLRQTDPNSANRLFDAALRATAQEHGASVDALLSLLTYAFPQGVEEAMSQGSSIDSARTRQLLGTLASKLSESEPTRSGAHYAAPHPDLSSAERFSLIQQHLPLFEQYAPEIVPALESVSHQLSARRPQAGVQLAHSQTAENALVDSSMQRFDGLAPNTDQRTRDHLMAQAAISAAHHGDLNKAEQSLRQIQDSLLRQETLDLINLEMALQALAEDDFPRARRHALEISQVKQRAAAYVMVAEKLASQGEDDRALSWLNEAYDFTSRVNDSQEKIWTLFRLIHATLRLDAPRAFDMTHSVVMALNRVRRHSQPSSLTATLEQSSLEEYITQIFEDLGRIDFDRALYVAMQLEAVDIRIMAELALCRAVLAKKKIELEIGK